MWPVAHPSQEAKRVQSNLFYRHKNASATFIRSQMDRMCLTLWRFCRFCQKWKRSLDFLATSAAASQIHMRMQDAASCQMCVWYFAKHKHNIAGKEHKTSLKLQCPCIEPSHFQGPSHVIHVSWMRKTQKPKNGMFMLVLTISFVMVVSHTCIFSFSPSLKLLMRVASLPGLLLPSIPVKSYFRNFSPLFHLPLICLGGFCWNNTDLVKFQWFELLLDIWWNLPNPCAVAPVLIFP